jgi:hypothetical protein
MSWRPVRKLEGIGNVFLGTELLDISEYDLEIYEEDPEHEERHAGNWVHGAKKIEGTVEGALPIRKDLTLLTEEGYSIHFYLRDSFGSAVISDFMEPASA